MTPQPTQPGQEGQERVWVRAVDGRPDRLLPTLVLSSYCPGPPENWIEVIPRPDREAPERCPTCGRRAMSSTERRNATGKIDEWVNAVITIWVPMDLSHDAPATEKVDAAVAEFDDLELPTDFVADVSWEDERTPFDPGATKNEDGSWNLPDQQETEGERPEQRGVPFEAGDPVPEFRSHTPASWMAYYCHGCEGSPGPIQEGECSRCGETVEAVEVVHADLLDHWVPASQLLRVEAERKELRLLFDDKTIKLEAAEAEVERLREALERIVGAADTGESE
jgi:hypothetical protein